MRLHHDCDLSDTTGPARIRPGRLSRFNEIEWTVKDLHRNAHR